MASAWAANDAGKAFRPAGGLLGGQAEAQSFHRHLQGAALEFERMYVERAAMSAALRNLERQLEVATSSHSSRPHFDADPVHLPSVAGMPAPQVLLRTAGCADGDDGGYRHDHGLGREVADSGDLSCPAIVLASENGNGHVHGGGFEEGSCVPDQRRVEATLSAGHLVAFDPAGPTAVIDSEALSGRKETLASEAEKPKKHHHKFDDFILHLSSSHIEREAAKILPKKIRSSMQKERHTPHIPTPPSCLCHAALAPIVMSPYFDAVTCGVIVLNALLVGFQMQYDGMVLGCDLDYKGYESVDPDTIWPGAPLVFVVLDIIFDVFFCVELLFRVVVYGKGLFKSFRNVLDIVIVGFGIVSSFAPISNLTVVRLMRLSKLSRMKNLKMNDWLESLRFLLTAIVKSQKMTIWSIGLLTCVQCIVALIMNSLLYSYMEDTDMELTSRQEVYYYYGTYVRTMITLFEVHLANWSPACRVLVDNVGMTWGAVFVSYRCAVGFCVLNVISAVFIQTTMRAAQNDMDMKIASRRMEQQMYMTDLKHFFQNFDTSMDGFMSLDELKQAAEDEHVRVWLHALEICPHDLEAVFNVLDVNGDNFITPQELLLTAERIKGTAKSIDVVHLLANMKVINAKLDRLL